MHDELYIPNQVLNNERLSADAKVMYGMLLLETSPLVIVDRSLEKRLGTDRAELLKNALELVNHGYLGMHASITNRGYQINVYSLEVLDDNHIKKARKMIPKQVHHHSSNDNQLTLF